MNNFTRFISSGWVLYNLKPIPQCIQLKSLQNPPKSQKIIVFPVGDKVYKNAEDNVLNTTGITTKQNIVIAVIFLQVNKLFHELQSSIKQNSFSTCTTHSKKLLPITTL